MRSKILLTIGLFFLAVCSLYAQAPKITAFSPVSGPVGTSVTITGTNFNATAAGNIVFFGATMATVTAAGTTSLTVTVPAGATYQPISVLNGATALIGYSASPFVTTFTPNKGSITTADIAAPVDLTVTGPGVLAISDLDGDGKPDLVVANGTSVSIYRNTSASGSITVASFAAKVDFTTGSSARSIAIGDLDGDGKPDLAVLNFQSKTISIFRNTSASGSITAASFAANVDFAAGINPVSIAIGDLDGDGKPELAVADNANIVSIFRNTSSSGSITTASFAAKVNFTNSKGPIIVAIRDLDGDGKPDLAVTTQNGTVSIYRNTSSSGSITAASFAAEVDFTTGSLPQGLAIGDLDGDGKPDLAVTNSSGNTVSIFRNTSVSGSITTASFAAKVDFTTGTSPYSVAIGDLDGDGKPDLAVANSSSNTVSIYRNTSASGSITDASFAANVDFTTGTGPSGLAIGDLDGDGKPDLALSNSSGNTVSILRNSPAFPAITSFTPSSGPVGTLVTITGTNLGSPTAFTIGGVSAIVVSNTGTQLVGMVMPGTVTGVVSLTAAGSTVTGSNNFTVTATSYPSVQQGAKLVGTGNIGAANQGYSIALSADGNTAIIGGKADNTSQGAAWIYTRSGVTWTQQTKLVGTGNTNAAAQGYSVAISADGNTAIIGGISDGNSQGAVWVFTRSGTTWTQQGTKLVGTGGVGSNVGQGYSVALSADGNTAIEGGIFDNNTQGAAWVFTRNSTTWTQQGAKLAGTSQQGISVSLSADGNTAIIGSNGSGAAIYTRSGGTWTQQGATLLSTGGGGRSVSLSADGNTAIIGGGGQWVFIRSGGTWTQQGAELALTGKIGAISIAQVSLSADGNTAVVGGSSDNSNQGATWVFTRSGGTWTQQGAKLIGTGNTGAAAQGYSVSLSADGSTGIIGGQFDNSNQGAAWVFTVGQPQSITFAAISAKTYGAADFDPGATASSGLPVSYASSNTTVATIVSGKIHIIGAGTSTITASQAGNSIYSAAASVPQTLTVTPAALTVTADNQTQVYGSASPALTVSYTGFVNGDTTSSLTTQPTIITTGTAASVVNTYPITASGAASSNYTFTYAPGTLTVTPAVLTVTADNKSKNYSDANPALTITYSGFANGDTQASLTTQAVAATIATDASAAGTYPITASGAAAANYTFNYVAGVLTVNPAPAPTVTAMSANAGITGTSVTLTGTYLLGATAVSFGGTPAASFTINSATSITAVVGTGASGSIAVTTPTGTGAIAGFVYTLMLPPDNFKFTINSATCKGSNNGSVNITAKQALNYTATITGNGLNTAYPFTASQAINNLAASTYSVCITVAGQASYQQCFTVVITEPADLSVYSTVSNTANSIDLALSGGAQYNISLNGTLYTTTNNTITLPLKEGNNDLSVTTDKLCQGTFAKIINVSGKIIPYPDPFQNTLSLNVGNTLVKNVAVEIHSVSDGALVYSKQYTDQSGVLQLDVTGLKSGIYALRLSLDHTENIFKIMKK